MNTIKQCLILLTLVLAACNPQDKPPAQHHHVTDEQANVLSNQPQDSTPYLRKEVIYGRTYGTALTMDVFTPNQKPNGRGIVLFISEGWYSGHEKIEYNIPIYINKLIESGYTVFAVVHGSNPKFSLHEVVEQAKRAVRFIRHHARDFGIDPSMIGAMGDSAGGHLSLLVGSDTTGMVSHNDPVEGESCKVQAVVAFFPPTDFFNWGKPGQNMLGEHPKVTLKGAFTFYVRDTVSNALVQVRDQAKIYSIVRNLSPIYKVNSASAPTLIVYGDRDSFIPIQQSQALARRFGELRIPCETIVEKGGEHDELTIKHNLGAAIGWFDKYLILSTR